MTFKNKKNGNRYDLLISAVDATNDRAGTDVVIYCTANKSIITRVLATLLFRVLKRYAVIFVRDRDEFFDKFETQSK